jgi:hypothetical protein
MLCHIIEPPEILVVERRNLAMNLPAACWDMLSEFKTIDCLFPYLVHV